MSLQLLDCGVRLLLCGFVLLYCVAGFTLVVVGMLPYGFWDWRCLGFYL